MILANKCEDISYCNFPPTSLLLEFCEQGLFFDYYNHTTFLNKIAGFIKLLKERLTLKIARNTISLLLMD